MSAVAKVATGLYTPTVDHAGSPSSTQHPALGVLGFMGRKQFLEQECYLHIFKHYRACENQYIKFKGYFLSFYTMWGTVSFSQIKAVAWSSLVA